MTDSRLLVRKAAVLGAGVMGAQIAAHLVNANIAVLLFDLAAKEGRPNAIVDKAIAGLAKLEPSPLAAADRAAWIDAANYDTDLASLADCDLIIEAIAERLDWKRDLYAKIAPHVAPDAVLATNTSGLSIAALAQSLPAELRPRFLGAHFFNPPRYMHLVELIGHPGTDAALLDRVESFLVTTLGKGVVRAKDTPNFVANRVGIFSVLATIAHTERFGLPYDVVDALTGPAIGRARSATYRTCDVVGLDTMAHVVQTMHDTLPDDPWHPLFDQPPVLAALVARGALGQKSGAGFFRKVGREIQVLDPKAGDYRPAAGVVDASVSEILALKHPGEKLAKLRASPHPQAQFLWAIFRDLFHYCAFHLAAIADNARDVDLALRWGFGWSMGPFELWQAAGWSDVAGWIRDDIDAGRALARVPLPPWVSSHVVASGVHTPNGAYSASADAFRARSTLAVYKRQPYPDPVLGERFAPGTTIMETPALRMWRLDGDVAIVSFRTKANTIGEDVLDALLTAVERAERDHAGLVIWQTTEPFSLGANLAAVEPDVRAGRWSVVESVVAKFQQTSQRLKYCLVPTVAAVRGMALGGSCEFILHCDRTVAALESYIGLVEAGVGLLPAGGGCKELAVRSTREAARGAVGAQADHFPFLRSYFQTIATATVSKSARNAKELGFLRPADVVVPNVHELLYVALREAQALADAGYRPPLAARNVPVAGTTGIATLTMLLVNMRDGGFISAYDFEIGRRIARVLCGGELDPGTTVDESWFLALERDEFMALLHNGKTIERIVHTLKTGKPLRN